MFGNTELNKNIKNNLFCFKPFCGPIKTYKIYVAYAIFVLDITGLPIILFILL